MEKFFCYDCETTGVDTDNCAIHQLSGIIVINGEIKEKFNFRIAPHNGAHITDEALDISGVTLEQIKAYPSHIEVFGQINNLLKKYVDKYNKTDKFHLVGYNNRNFDDRFLRKLWERCNDNYFGSYFWADSIDAMILASAFLCDKRSTMADFKLKTVAAKCGIEVDEDKLHDAEYDIELTYRLASGIMKLIRFGAEQWREKNKHGSNTSYPARDRNKYREEE